MALKRFELWILEGVFYGENAQGDVKLFQIGDTVDPEFVTEERALDLVKAGTLQRIIPQISGGVVTNAPEFDREKRLTPAEVKAAEQRHRDARVKGEQSRQMSVDADNRQRAASASKFL